MATDIKLWKIEKEGSELCEIPSDSLSKLSAERRKEDDLRNWVIDKPEIINEYLSIIGKEIDNIDILGFDTRDGAVVIIETKRNEPRDAVKQVIDYASYVAEKNEEWFRDKAAEKGKDISDLKEIDLESPRIYIVATQPSDEIERMVRFLASYDIDINIVIIRYHKDKSNVEYLTRTYFLTEETKKELREPRKRRRWDEESYFEKIKESTGEKVVSAIRNLYDKVPKTQQLRARFGTGKEPSLMIDSMQVNSVLYLWSDGTISLWHDVYKKFDENKLTEFYQKIEALGFEKRRSYYCIKIDKLSEEKIDILLKTILWLISS